MKKKLSILSSFVIIILGLTGCGNKEIENQNKKIVVEDILGKWVYHYDDTFQKYSETIEFKNDGIMLFNRKGTRINYEDKPVEINNNEEFIYKLSYGINSTTYIEIGCKENEKCETFYLDIQDIDIINGKLYFLGGANHPGYERVK